MNAKNEAVSKLTINAANAAANIMGCLERFVQESGFPRSKRFNTYASSYETCTRKLVLLMTDGDRLPPWETETLAKFLRGRARERTLVAQLIQASEYASPPFEVVGQQQRFEIKDREGTVVITGKVDLRLKFDGFSPPVEVKDWHVNLTDRVDTFDDLLKNRWTQKGAYQLLCYLYAAEESFGFMLLSRPGLPKLLPVELLPYLEQVEEFLSKATEAQQHKFNHTLPDFIDDPDECSVCDFFGDICNPPIKSEGVKVVTDPDIIEMLERRHQCQETAKEFKDLDDTIKKKFYGQVDNTGAVAGKFILKGNWQKATSYPVPKDVKEKYKQVKEKGKYILKITKLD